MSAGARRPRRWLVATILAVAAMSTHADFLIRSRVVDHVTYVHLADVARYYGLGSRVDGKAISLSSPRRQLELHLERRAATINGVGTHLFYEPREVDGLLLISERDLALVLDPVFRSAVLPRATVNRIVVDPGHGGKDVGAIGPNGVREKDINLQLALRLKALLVSRGYQVLLTREGDSFPSLGERARLANRAKADLFVSIHVNKADSTSASGIETWVATPEGVPGTYDQRPTGQAAANARFDQVSARLAHEVQKGLMQFCQTDDRGVRHARFAVLRLAECPAVLVETGFLSNPEEAARLQQAWYQERIAAGICNGVVSLHHVLAGPRR